MRYREKRRPSPALVISILALALAIGGGSAIALQGRNTVDSGDVKPNAIKSPDIARNAVKTSEIAQNAVRSGDVRADTLQGVDVRANSLTGEDIDEDAVGPTSGDQRFSFSLAFGQNQQIAQYGPLSLLAECIQNTTDNAGNANRDVARVTIATTENGAVFRSNQDDKAGTAAADFLNTDTPPGDRVVLEASAATGTGLLDENDELFAMAPSGARITIPNETGDQAVNLFGQACIFNGVINKLG
jgi:hypothetical protein